MPETDYIALRSDLRLGSRTYLPGDKFEPETVQKVFGLTDRQLRNLQHQRFYGAATPELMRIAMARRPAGSPRIPEGFTEAYLIEAGYLSAPPAPAAPPPPAADKRPPVRASTVLETIQLGDDRIEVNGRFIQPKKVTKFTYYDVADATGRLLRASSFRKLADAKDFLKALPPVTAEDQESEGIEDDGDVRSGAG